MGLSFFQFVRVPSGLLPLLLLPLRLYGTSHTDYHRCCACRCSSVIAGTALDLLFTRGEHHSRRNKCPTTTPTYSLSLTTPHFKSEARFLLPIPHWHTSGDMYVPIQLSQWCHSRRHQSTSQRHKFWGCPRTDRGTFVDVDKLYSQHHVLH